MGVVLLGGVKGGVAVQVGQRVLIEVNKRWTDRTLLGEDVKLRQVLGGDK